MRTSGWCRICERRRHVRVERYQVRTPAGVLDVGVCLPCDDDEYDDSGYDGLKGE